MAQQIGQIVKTLQPAESLPSPLTDSRLPCARSQSVALVPPTNDAEWRALVEWAETAPSLSEPLATFDEIADALMFLNSVLPSRNFDEEAGEKRTAVFIQILADYTKSQIDFMVHAAARELEWFPVPKQMLEILDRAPKPFNPKATARRLAHSYEQDKFRAWLRRIPEMEEPEINAAPDLWKRVAETETWLWRRGDGSYTHRSKAKQEGWA